MHVVNMPKSGQTMEEGTVLHWLKCEGEEISVGEALLEIETDKAIAEITSDVSGVLRKILVQEGQTVPVLSPLAYVGQLDEAFPPASVPLKMIAETGSNLTSSQIESGLMPERSTGAVSPRARKLAREYGIDVEQIAGTGPGGRITEDDVRAFLDQRQDKIVRRLSTAQQAIAKRMQRSIQTVPHFYLSVEVRMDKILETKKAWVESAHVTITDFVIQAAGLALGECPEINCRWEGETLLYNAFVNIGIAVAAEDCLVVAVVPDVNKKALGDIAGERRQAIEMAKQGRVTAYPASLTVSNLGMYGVNQFAAIINPPELAVLAVGQITPTAEIRASGSRLVTSQRMTMTFSCDHRALNGVQGARFLNKIRERLEDPVTWMR